MNTEIKPLAREFEEYLRDESRRVGSAEQILLAKSEEDIRTALRTCLQITVQGARTGIAAGAVPNGGLILNLSRMNHVGDVEDDRMTVQPGARLAELREKVKDAGLFFPPDPTEISASIGGMLACNASGAMSYHYGPTRKWVHALRVMLPDGDVVRIGRGERIDGLSFSLATIGQAAGTAAAMCVDRKIDPRTLGQKHIGELQQELLKDDQTIPGIRNEDPADLARSARVTASSSASGAEDVGVAPLRRIPLNMERSVMIPVEKGKTIKSVSLYLDSKGPDVRRRPTRALHGPVEGQTAGWKGI